VRLRWGPRGGLVQDWSNGGPKARLLGRQAGFGRVAETRETGQGRAPGHSRAPYPSEESPVSRRMSMSSSTRRMRLEGAIPERDCALAGCPACEGLCAFMGGRSQGIRLCVLGRDYPRGISPISVSPGISAGRGLGPERERKPRYRVSGWLMTNRILEGEIEIITGSDHWLRAGFASLAADRTGPRHYRSHARRFSRCPATHQ
jgi:hypothetical protein